jgi:hypothetical protein
MPLGWRHLGNQEGAGKVLSFTAVHTDAQDFM